MDYISIQLTDKDKNPIMPITTTNEIITSDGKTLEQKLQDIINYISGGIENGMEVEY